MELMIILIKSLKISVTLNLISIFKNKNGVFLCQDWFTKSSEKQEDKSNLESPTHIRNLNLEGPRSKTTLPEFNRITEKADKEIMKINGKMLSINGKWWQHLKKMLKTGKLEDIRSIEKKKKSKHRAQ